MAKFTVLFKDKPIKSEIFQTGVVHIGRDDMNNIVLDSSDVAPAHTAIVLRKRGSIIKQLNENFPLVVNNNKIKSCTLQDGDIISIGKYNIVFNTEDKQQSNTVSRASVHSSPETDNMPVSAHQTAEAKLQIMEGEHIGRIIPLAKAMTRLGRSGAGGVVIISRRKNGYYISALDGENTLEVNGERVGEHTVPLKNNDIVLIDNTRLLFFT